MKKILNLIAVTLLSFTSLVYSQPTVFVDTYLDSSVTFDGTLYHYSYVSDSKIGKKDISNITIKLCDPTSIFNIYSDDSFESLFETERFKFDSIQPEGDDFVFGFYSYYPPTLSNAAIKSSTSTYFQTAYVPSCIPEPTTFALGSFGLLTLLSRRKRNV